MRAPIGPLSCCLLSSLVACATGDEPPRDEDAGAAYDPCADDGLTFCHDRVDDTCDGVDEPCPSTQPADVAPLFACEDAPPSSVLAIARFPGNAQVAGGCAFVYQGESGAYFAAVSLVDGPDPRGPMGENVLRCGFDTGARKHAFMTTSPVESCPPLTYTYPEQPQNQLLSSSCRRMIRNVLQDDPRYTPDIQFLPGDRADQETRLATFDSVEVACIGIVGRDGEPIREEQDFVTQASAPFTLLSTFEER